MNRIREFGKSGSFHGWSGLIVHNTDGTRSVPTTMNVRGAMNCATTNAESCLNQDLQDRRIWKSTV